MTESESPGKMATPMVETRSLITSFGMIKEQAISLSLLRTSLRKSTLQQISTQQRSTDSRLKQGIQSATVTLVTKSLFLLLRSLTCQTLQPLRLVTDGML
jgi:hypothetical protein